MEAVERLPPDRRAFCETTLYTGCRICEALSLSRSSFDAEASVLAFRTLKKGDRLEYRRIPITLDLMTSLLTISPFDPQARIWQFDRTAAWRFIKRAMKERKLIERTW